MQRKYAIALGSLFTALIEGCVARVPVDPEGQEGSDGSESGGSGSDTSGDTTVGTSTSTSGPSTTTSGPSTTTSATTVDPCADPFVEAVEIDAAQVEGYDVGEVLPLDLCTAVCTTRQYYDSLDECLLTGLEVGGDSSDSGSSDGTVGGSDGGNSADSGDVATATVECSYVVYCGDGGRRSAGLVTRGDCDSDDAIAAWFASMAHSEAASVTSFLRLQLELAQHGAPEELRTRLWEAARDEVRHARAMRRLARARDVEPRRPQHVPVSDRALEEIARENAVEGCVAETWSALLCAWQARHCSSPELAEILRGIAVDETRHAELAWAIDAWVRDRLDDDACARIDAARRGAAARLVAMADELGGEQLCAELGLPRPAAARTLASGLQAALWS